MLCLTLSNCQFKIIFSIAVANADWCNLRLNKIKDLCLFSRLVNITLVSIVFKLLTLLALIKPWLFTGWFRAFYCNTVRDIIVLPMFFSKISKHLMNYFINLSCTFWFISHSSDVLFYFYVRCWAFMDHCKHDLYKAIS